MDVKNLGLVLLLGAVACSEEPETPEDAGARPVDGGHPDTGGPADTGTDAGDSPDLGTDAGDLGSPPASWEHDHCLDRECYYIRQSEPGADDQACNGRAPTDLGTVDAEGLRDCPFLSFQNVRLAGLMAPQSGSNRRRSFFVGGGTYATFPIPIQLLGDGTNADEAVRLTNYRGERAVLSGDGCPSSCTIETETGTVTVSPCCSIPCPSCSADPRCVDTGDGCGVPWTKSFQTASISGQWARIEGLEIGGCVSDAIVVGMRTTPDGQQLVPNDHLFIANNVIHGCDVNENIKGYRNGPGPLQGGPYWGPVHIVGNEMLEMGSQGIDATGVQNWLVEDNYLHDPKPIDGCLETNCDGGGIGFKNGGAQARIRNNWLEGNNGIGMGGVAGSCERDTSPPSAFGCFQTFEMIEARVENNVVLDAPANGLTAYQCDDCRFVGNYVRHTGPGAMFFVQDDCPGPRCPAHNPNLLATRGLHLELNWLDAGIFGAEGPYLFAYRRDALPTGPVGNGMISRHNTFCGPDGLAETGTPEQSLELFAHTDPPGVYAWASFGVDHLGDVGSVVFNDPLANVAPCPGPSTCRIDIALGADAVRWQAPSDAVRCALVLDGTEVTVPCTGTRSFDAAQSAPGRHYAALRAERAEGGAACGTSYQVAAPMIGASCVVAIEGTTLRWRASGTRCHLYSDGATDLGDVPCEGERPLRAELGAGPRHHVRLQVNDSPDGQTTCGVMYTP